MTDISQNVLDRIRKSLALAASPNPGEAETAMAHARKLMEKYGIDKTDLELSEIGESEEISEVTLTVPGWHPSFTRWTTCSKPAPSSRRQEIRGSVTNPNERFKSTAPKQSLSSPSTSLQFFAVRFSKIAETTSKRSSKAQTPGGTTHRRNQRWLIRSVRNGLTRSRTVFAICSSLSRPSWTNTRSATLKGCTPTPPATSLTFSPRTKILKMQ